VTYATLMVHLELGSSNVALMQTTLRLAQQFDAHVIGIAASQPLQAVFGGSYATGDTLQQDRSETETEMKVAEAEFRNALQPRGGGVEWRSEVMFGDLSAYFASAARSADLIIAGAASGSALDGARRVTASELVMQAGRPVLIVPRGTEGFKLDRVVIGWKDTRESRRAARDALPLLKKAAYVALVEIAPENELDAARYRLNDVVAWLKRHGVAATPFISQSIGDDAAQLKAIADEQSADLTVAGAYGHSRLREWVLGGVTSDLLLRADRCSLVSH
jgi:nucleotide-binding universal stress UspA family protein